MHNGLSFKAAICRSEQSAEQIEDCACALDAGTTGAGKSSMLNALLGEENILPTNGMRACTASVIEISHTPKAGYVHLQGPAAPCSECSGVNAW